MNKIQTPVHSSLTTSKIELNDYIFQIPKKLGIFTITILYDLRGFLTDPKRMQSLNDLATSTLTTLEYIGEHPISKKVETIGLFTLSISKTAILNANGVLGTFKIFHSYSDLRNNFSNKTIWKQHQILFKAIENTSNFCLWVMANGIPASAAQIASNTGGTIVFSVSKRAGLNMLKNVSGLIACVFAVIDAAVVINDMKKASEHKKASFSIAADTSKFFVIILSGSLGLFTPGSPVWLVFLISWSIANVAKARLEIQEERACTLAIK